MKARRLLDGIDKILPNYQGKQVAREDRQIVYLVHKSYLMGLVKNYAKNLMIGLHSSNYHVLQLCFASFTLLTSF